MRTKLAMFHEIQILFFDIKASMLKKKKRSKSVYDFGMNWTHMTDLALCLFIIIYCVWLWRKRGVNYESISRKEQINIKQHKALDLYCLYLHKVDLF